jgi:hypothetical protein
MVLSICLAVFSLGLVYLGFLHPVKPFFFGELAKAFLHGRLYLDIKATDLATYQNKAYTPFGPLPGILLMPLVAIFGANIPLTTIGLPITLLSIPAFWILWKEIGIENYDKRIWLTTLTFLGTVYLSCLTVDSSYFLSHILVVGCLAWALVFSLQGKMPLLVGFLVAAATLTRTPDVLAAIPLAFLLHKATQNRFQWSLVFVGPVVSIALTGLYNYLRFNSFLESGYNLQQLSYSLLRLYRSQGLFSIVHIPRNLYYFLIAPPLPSVGPDHYIAFLPHLYPSEWGMGLLFVSPWLLLGLSAKGQLAKVLALGTLLLLGPLMLYYGIGWIQWGYRYGTDVLPFMAPLAALGMERLNLYKWKFLLPLTLYCVFINLAGSLWLFETIK